jgi:hypothetical protein
VDSASLPVHRRSSPGLVLRGFAMPPGGGATFDENSVPLEKGGFQGVGAVTDNFAWVIGPETHPGARDRVKSSQDFTFAPPLRGRGFSMEPSMNPAELRRA